MAVETEREKLMQCLDVFQLHLSAELHSPRPVGHRLRDHRPTDTADHSAEQVAGTGARRRTQRRIVRSSFCFFLILAHFLFPQRFNTG